MDLSILNQQAPFWIWLSSVPAAPNQYVEFRHEFDLKEPAVEASLLICADTNYAVWVNERFIDTGQYQDYPDHRVSDTVDIGTALRPGRNVICILVHYQGQSASMYFRGEPGLIYLLDCDGQYIGSGADTLMRLSPAYLSGPMPRVTGQLGFTFCYDARREDRWRTPGYVPGDDWNKATEQDMIPLDLRPIAAERPIRKLRVERRCHARVVAHGVLIRPVSDNQTPAQQMMTDFFSSRPVRESLTPPPDMPSFAAGLAARCESAHGVYFVMDLGREEAGLLEIELDAPEGTLLDVAHGEHLEDLRVRAHVGGRNFANRYICRAGRQHFTHYTSRVAGRYVEMHAIFPEQAAATAARNERELVLLYAGIRPTDYPVEFEGEIALPDSVHNRINDVSVRTLHLCMHEHYEDCPWREQSLYSMDSRNQALAGYYCFGDYQFPAASFDLLGRRLHPDGYLELCSPAEIRITIPSFTLAWILCIDDHYLFSGDDSYARQQYPVVREILDKRFHDAAGGLLPTPCGERYWNFYEWAPGLDGSGYRGFEVLDRERFDAPLNLFYSLALRAGSRIASACGADSDAELYTATSRKVADLCHATFWDGERNIYQTYSGPDTRPHYAELTQALALLAEACPLEQADSVRLILASRGNGLVETTISHCLYKFEALMMDPERYAKAVFDQILDNWGYMLQHGATTFWETILGAADFSDAGSLCHGWSGIPVYFYYAYLLGIRPVEPGFRKFRFSPQRNIMEWAKGQVPTPAGPIRAAWTNCAGESDELVYPDAITLDSQ